MKRITRTTNQAGNRVWLDQFGHWTPTERFAFEFDEEEAVRRAKRIPHAEVVDAPIKPATTEESKDV